MREGIMTGFKNFALAVVASLTVFLAAPGFNL